MYALSLIFLAIFVTSVGRRSRISAILSHRSGVPENGKKSYKFLRNNKKLEQESMISTVFKFPPLSFHMDRTEKSAGNFKIL